jgi:hypothetical protein
MNNRTMRPVELAERWNCSTGWLANSRSARTGPAFLKLGTRVVYRVEDIEAYEAANLMSTV